MTDRQTGRTARPLAAAAVFIAAFLLALLAAEGLVRAYAALVAPKMMVLDDRLGWRHGASRSKHFVNEHGERILVVHDQNGLRVAGEPGPAGEGPRLLILGDSFTEAVHVSHEDTFAARIGRGIPGLQVLNAGVGGYGTVQQYLFLESRVDALAPDAVLLAFFDNDLDDNCLSYSPGFGPRPYARLTTGGVVLQRALDPGDFRRFILPVPFAVTLNRHSYFYNFLNNRVYQPLVADRLRRQLKADTERTQACGRFEVFFDVVDRMAALLGERSVPLAIALIPSKQIVMSGDGADHERILAHCAIRGHRCLGLLPALRAATASSTLYFEHDIHWTAEGHRVAAAAMLPLVREQLASRPE